MTPRAPKRVALYTRVSRKSQTTENQERELRKVAEQRGWTIVDTYTDHGMQAVRDSPRRLMSSRWC